MPRSGGVKTRVAALDPVYNNRIVTKLINTIMKGGKKSVAQKHVYGAFDLIKKKDQDPLEVFQKAIDNIAPNKKVRPRRVGGASYLVPSPVRGSQKQSIALRWLVEASTARSNSEYKTLMNKLAAELMDAANMTGGAVEKRLTTHKVADANKAFAHFRW